LFIIFILIIFGKSIDVNMINMVNYFLSLRASEKHFKINEKKACKEIQSYDILFLVAARDTRKRQKMTTIFEEAKRLGKVKLIFEN